MNFLNLKKWKRNRIRRRPWPKEWSRILRQYLPVFDAIRSDYKEQWKQIIQILYTEQRLEGCADIRITDDKRLTILSQAALLLLGNESDYYSDIRSILVYPDIYTAPVQRREQGSFVVTEGFESREGEAWSFGNLVLAWDSVRRQSQSFGNGINVVIHEFSHHLDQLYGVSDRIDAPADNNQTDPDWILHLRMSYLDFVEKVERGKSAFMDSYGAQNPAEFFAVASENFIERPAPLNNHYPRLFQALRTFYEYDSRTLFPEN